MMWFRVFYNVVSCPNDQFIDETRQPVFGASSRRYIISYMVGNTDDKSTIILEGSCVYYYNNICCDRRVIVG